MFIICMAVSSPYLDTPYQSSRLLRNVVIVCLFGFSPHVCMHYWRGPSCLASSQSVLLLPTLLDLSLTVRGTSFYNWNETVVPLGQLYEQARIPVQGKSSVCLICMKYRIICVIIIMSSLGQILLSYMANTSRTHAHACARTRAHRYTHCRRLRAGFRCSVASKP